MGAGWGEQKTVAEGGGGGGLKKRAERKGGGCGERAGEEGGGGERAGGGEREGGIGGQIWGQTREESGGRDGVGGGVDEREVGEVGDGGEDCRERKGEEREVDAMVPGISIPYQDAMVPGCYGISRIPGMVSASLV